MNELASNEQFLMLLTSHQRRLAGYVRTLVVNRADAEEILQEVNLYICRHADEFKLGTDFAAWALRIAHFCVLTWRARASRDRLVFDDALLERIAAIADPPDGDAESRREALERCIKKLLPEEQELITRLYSDPDVTPQGLADRVGKSVNAIYIAIHRIRVRLFNCIERTLAAKEGGS
jgi:RNA polymerase sigma-70 factor (ECF subfamily)